MPVHRICGLDVLSDFPISAPQVENGSPDLTIVSGPVRALPDEAPEGTIVAETEPPWPRHLVVRSERGYTIRYFDVCDILLAGDLAYVEVRPAREESRALSQLLCSGSVIAKILTLAGECVLHASAVEVHGKAIAFVGHSGGGKSTLAALLCSAGAAMVTDDVLRLRSGPRGFDCFSGSNEIRLRPAAASLATILTGRASEISDGRTGVVLDRGTAMVPLGCIVFPRPSRTHASLETRRLDEADAVMSLTRHPRTLGWKAHEIIERMFRWNALIARTTPVYEAYVPWGPPFDARLPSELFSILDQDHTDRIFSLPRAEDCSPPL